MRSRATATVVISRRSASSAAASTNANSAATTLSQSSLRLIVASKEAMADLKGILAGRAAFYSKADFRLDTSHQPLEPTFMTLRALVRQALQLPT
jgi:hypothetical protein